MNRHFISGILSFFSTSKSNNDMKHLKEGDAAPAFEALNEKGETVKLSDFKGKKLALFFYPASGTPSCTAEACSLRDGYAALEARGIAVLGVSPDSMKKQQNFSKKHGFPYALIADDNLAMTHAFGVWGPKKFMGREFDGVHRTTFLIDENGIIEKIFEKVETSNHAQQILNALG